MCVDHRGAGSRTRVRVRRRVLKRKPRCRGIGLRSSLRRTPGTPAEPLSGSVLRKEGSNRFDRPGHWSGIPTYGAGRTIQVTEPVMKIRSLDHRDQNEPWGTKVRGCESRDSCTLAPLNPGPTGSFWPTQYWSRRPTCERSRPGTAGSHQRDDGSPTIVTDRQEAGSADRTE